MSERASMPSGWPSERLPTAGRGTTRPSAYSGLAGAFSGGRGSWILEAALDPISGTCGRGYPLRRSGRWWIGTPCS